MSTKEKLQRNADLLLEIAEVLMISGANTHRVDLNIDRFASALQCESYSLITQKTIILMVIDNVTRENCTKVKNLRPHKIDFAIISSVSKTSWIALSEGWTIDRIAQEIDTIKQQKTYPRIIILSAVSLAGAGFCKIFGGDYRRHCGFYKYFFGFVSITNSA